MMAHNIGYIRNSPFFLCVISVVVLNTSVTVLGGFSQCSRNERTAVY